MSFPAAVFNKSRKCLLWFQWVLTPEKLEIDVKASMAEKGKTQGFFRWLFANEVLEDTDTAYFKPPGKTQGFFRWLFEKESL